MIVMNPITYMANNLAAYLIAVVWAYMRDSRRISMTGVGAAMAVNTAAFVLLLG